MNLNFFKRCKHDYVVMARIGGDIQSTALKCEKCDKKMVMYHGITGKPTYNYIIKNGLRLR